ncbi:MAG: ABC transporter permease [Rhabdochlamydiaceae bacterium]|nr:ABC transporter permease [Rhabdochlamydiaceae bacterium]
MQISLSTRHRRMRAFIKKELYQIRSDFSTFLICMVLPLFLLFLYGYGVSLDLNHLRLGVVMEDSSPEAQSLIESFTNSPYFDVKIFRDKQVAIEEIIRGSLRGFVVIPSYFSEFYSNQNKIAPVQVIADGSEPNTANFVQNYVEGAFQKYLQQQGQPNALVRMESRVWYNEELESRYFLLSGSLAIIMTLIGTLLTALVVSREWERGTMESLFSTAIQIPELVLGKLIPYFMLGMISMGLCVFVSVFIFGLPFRGSLLSLLMVSSAFLFCAVGLGLMISTLSKNQVVAYQVSIITGFLPSYILSGFLFEISSMPTWIQWLTHIIPARYFVQCLQTLFLVGDVPYLIWRNMVPMIVIGLVFFLITARKTVKRLD